MSRNKSNNDDSNTQEERKFKRSYNSNDNDAIKFHVSGINEGRHIRHFLAVTRAPRTKRIRIAIWNGNNDRKSLSRGRKTILLSNSITLGGGELTLEENPRNVVREKKINKIVLHRFEENSNSMVIK